MSKVLVVAGLGLLLAWVALGADEQKKESDGGNGDQPWHHGD